MKVEVLSTTVVTTGNKLLVLTDPTMVPKSIHVLTGVNADTAAISSTGFSDGVRERSVAMYSSMTKGTRSRRSLTHSIKQYRVNNGVFTEVLSGKVKSDGFDNPGILGLEFDVCEQTTSLDIIVYGE